MSFEARRSDGATDTLVLTLHGEGAGEDQFHGAAQAFLPGAHVVSPRGDADGEPAPRFLPRSEHADAADLMARAEALAAFLEAEAARAGASRLVGLGYSDGADLLAALSLLRPGLIDWLVLMHPARLPAIAPGPGLAMTRVLITAGRDDPLSPPEAAQALGALYAAHKADVTVAWHPGGHEIPQSEVEAVARFLG